MTGAKWAQALVFGWMGEPGAALSDLCDAAAVVGVRITPQGLDARFGERSAARMRLVLEGAAGRMVAAAGPAAVPLLERFPGGVRVRDATTASLPDEPAGVWRGCGGSRGNTASAAEAVVEPGTRPRVLLGGRLSGPLLLDGRRQEKGARLEPAREGSLEIQDLGFWDVGRMAEADAAGGYVLSRLEANAAVYDAEAGERLDVGAWLKRELRRGGRADRRVLVGGEQRLGMRLLALRASAPTAERRRRRRAKRGGRKEGRAPSKARLALRGYGVRVANVPEGMLGIGEAVVLARARRQVGMLPKLWKSHGRIDEWRTGDPWRILAELYAKLAAMLIKHWLSLAGCRGAPNRSLFKAAEAIAEFAPVLASGIASPTRLPRAVRSVAPCLGAGSKMHRRRGTPYTHQLLSDPSLQGGLA